MLRPSVNEGYENKEKAEYQIRSGRQRKCKVSWKKRKEEGIKKKVG